MAQTHKAVCGRGKECKRIHVHHDLSDMEESLKQQELKDKTPVNRKIGEMKTAICNRIDEQVAGALRQQELAARSFDDVDSRLQTMITMQETIQTLHKDLKSSEIKLGSMLEKIDKLDQLVLGDDEERFRV